MEIGVNDRSFKLWKNFFHAFSDDKSFYSLCCVRYREWDVFFL